MARPDQVGPDVGVVVLLVVGGGTGSVVGGSVVGGASVVGCEVLGVVDDSTGGTVGGWVVVVVDDDVFLGVV